MREHPRQTPSTASFLLGSLISGRLRCGKRGARPSSSGMELSLALCSRDNESLQLFFAEAAHVPSSVNLSAPSARCKNATARHITPVSSTKHQTTKPPKALQPATTPVHTRKKLSAREQIMQALRTGALAQGSLRAIRGGSRASTGRGWYQRYQRMGPDAFRKARAPNAFDWEAIPQQAVVAGQGEESERRRRRRAFFDIAVDGVSAGRVEFELAADLLPVTCENFLRLCRGAGVASALRQGVRLSATDGTELEPEGGGEEEVEDVAEKKLGYEGTVFHRVITGTGIMGGDVEGTQGTKSHSAFGMRFFPDEAFLIPHTAPGLLTMANSGVHSNGSQFVITTGPAGHLDGRSVAFGRVTSGLEVVKAVYGMYSIRGKPVSEITVSSCGEI